VGLSNDLSVAIAASSGLILLIRVAGLKACPEPPRGGTEFSY